MKAWPATTAKDLLRNWRRCCNIKALRCRSRCAAACHIARLTSHETPHLCFVQTASNFSLLPYNTFHLDETAAHFALLEKESQLAAIPSLPQPVKILGGGSNILLSGPQQGTVLRNELKGISIEKEDDDFVWLKVAAGENWHQFVLYAIAQGYGGVENLSLIPGTVGASPIQNIGAYGVEVKDVMDRVDFWHLEEERMQSLSAADCQFGYRDSVFKKALKGRVLITSVVFRLSKNPVLQLDYGAIRQELALMNRAVSPTIQDVSAAVIRIRQSKLPDPAVIGNAGSFFKNPVITAAHFAQLQQQFPGIAHYPAGEDRVKVPAGWLIETAGWKGFREGEVGVHERQALVLVNHGGAKGADIYRLAERMISDIEERFGIRLEMEVQHWQGH